MDIETSQPHSDTACPICTGLGEFIEIENAQDPAEGDVAESFPPEAQELRAPNESLAQVYRFSNERLQKCPRCGTYYWYRQWAPGGSEDVMHTYIHESIRRLGFLEAHVELHDALYQAYRRAQEYGGGYAAEYESVKLGVEAERTLLRARYGAIIAEAIDRIMLKYARSAEIAEMLALFSPQRDHSRQVEEERARDRERAAYHAGVLAEYLAYARASDLLAGLIQRLVRLLVDDVPQVRQIVRDALLRVLGDRTDQELARDLARETVQAAEPLTPRYAELEELVAACHKVIRPPSST
jgi:hypothetical protein